MENYYFQIRGQVKGPFGLDELAKHIDRKTFIWCEGMEAWYPAQQVNEVWPYLFKLKEPEPSFLKKITLNYFQLVESSRWYLVALLFAILCMYGFGILLDGFLDTDLVNFIISDLFNKHIEIPFVFYYISLFTISIFLVLFLLYIFSLKKKFV